MCKGCHGTEQNREGQGTHCRDHLLAPQGWATQSPALCPAFGTHEGWGSDPVLASGGQVWASPDLLFCLLQPNIEG